jgi:hypothetical protein
MCRLGIMYISERPMAILRDMCPTRQRPASSSVRSSGFLKVMQASGITCGNSFTMIAHPDESTAGSSFANETPSPQDEPLQEYCGYYRLNMTIPPAREELGWVLGNSRTNVPDNFVDFLLAPMTNQHALHSRHCRLRRLLQTGVLLAVSDSRKVMYR